MSEETKTQTGQKALPTPRSFKTCAKQWSIQVSLCSLPIPQITFQITSRKPSQTVYKETYFEDSLPSQIRENYFKEVYDLYLYLEREHQRSIKIYEFDPENKVLRFAHREAKKVFSLKMRMYVNGVEQVERESIRQSNRYSTNPYRMTMRQSMKKQEVTKEIVKEQAKPLLPISQVQNQSPKQSAKQPPVEIEMSQFSTKLANHAEMKQTTQTFDYPQLKENPGQWDTDLNYFENYQESEVQKPLVKFTEQEDIDYDKWMNAIQDNGSEIFPSKLSSSNQEIGDYLVDDSQSNPYDLHSHIIKSDIYEIDDDQDILASVQKENSQTQGIDMKSVVKENVQLRHQRDELLQKVSLLQQENNRLKQKIQAQQFQMNFSVEPKMNFVPPYPNLAQSMQAPQDLWASLNPSVSSNPYSSNLNPVQSHPFVGLANPNPFLQVVQQSLKVGNEWTQQNVKNKRSYKESPFATYFNPKFDISYKEFTLKDFEDNFFSYDWIQVDTMILDGNLLKTQGFDKVISNFGSDLKQVSAGYNGIRDVRNLETLPNLTKIDLRANPLSQNAISYLEWLKNNTEIQVLY